MNYIYIPENIHTSYKLPYMASITWTDHWGQENLIITWITYFFGFTTYLELALQKMDPEIHAFVSLYPLNVLNQIQKFKTKYGLHPSSEFTLESLDPLTFFVKTPAKETNGNGKKDSTEASR